MRISLEALTVLDAIARRGSFAAAAAELQRVPSAVTYTVHKLEQDLEVMLFERRGQRSVLTPAGKALLDEGRQLLRAASELEHRVKRVASGWESELRIAVSDVIPLSNFYPLLKSFYAQETGTRIRLTTEVLGGSWDALSAMRADLAIGAPGDSPAGGGYATRLLGHLDWCFVIPSGHPLENVPEPLPTADILKYRVVAAADSSRNLPPRSAGIVTAQDMLTVPNLGAKLEAQCAGLGVGFIPRSMVKRLQESGRALIREVEEPKQATPLYLAWRTGEQHSMARDWFVEHLPDLASLLKDSD